MAAVAWSTAVLLVAVLPGFAFYWAATTAGPFSRDTTPRSPLAQLALTVFFSLLTHAALIAACGWVSGQVVWAPIGFGSIGWTPFCPSRLVKAVDLKIVLDALLAAHDEARVQQLATNLASNSLWILAYVAVSVAMGLSLGYALVALVIRVGRGYSMVSEHGWLYTAMRTTTDPVAYPFVHVLTSTSHEGKHLMYVGMLLRCALRADGRFAYMILEKAEKYWLELAKLETSKMTSKIKGTGISTEALYIDGESVINVFFCREEMVDTNDIKGSLQTVDEVLGAAALSGGSELRATATVLEPTPLPPPPEGDPP